MEVKSFAFRVDASLEIGYGHIMRCLTMANELSNRSCKSFFICTKLDKNLSSQIKAMGHEVFEISKGYNNEFESEIDCISTQKIIDSLNIDWLILDHYLIDHKWEECFSISGVKIMVIDDLANRKHLCNILLDCNLGKTPESYHQLVPTKSRVLCGAKYSIVRDEFLLARNKSLSIRSNKKELRNILINIGASDPANLTEDVLKKLSSNKYIKQFSISVILSSISPHLDSISSVISDLGLTVKIFHDVKNMSNILLEQDLVIGSVGVSAWERCVMGVPSISLVAANNQLDGAKALHNSGATIVIDQSFNNNFSLHDAIDFYMNKKNLVSASKLSAKLVDGNGIKRIMSLIV